MLRTTQRCINYLKTRSVLLSNQTNVLIQQNRNTFVLKRRYPPPLHKKYEKVPRLKHKHFIYDMIENKNCKPQKKIDIVLLENVENVGRKGQKIALSSQKAYETLILPKLAVYSTPENIKKYYIEDEVLEDETCQYSSISAKRTLDHLSQCYLNITMSLHVPWTIEKWHLRVSFRKRGYIVPEYAITMPSKPISGPNLSIENKEFYVIVKINDSDEVKVRCKIHHHSNDPFYEIKYDLPTHQLSNIAIFPEDQPILDSLPKHRLADVKNK